MLADEFTAMGLVAGSDVREDVRAQVWARGNQEFKRLQEEIGIDITPFKGPCIQGLGVGITLTEMVLLGIPLTPEELSSVTALGGLAILMVSAFDSALDAGVRIPQLFPLDRGVEYAEHCRREPPLIRSAVELYFKRLAAFPQTRPHVRRLIEKAINRMYTAELQSGVGPGISRQSWWRKNALPIAILGIPAWMVSEVYSPDQLQRHLAWLCRMGEFFGWLDDCVDYDDDLANAHANRLGCRLQTMSQSRLVSNIGEQARRILSRWESINSASRAQEYFAVIVWDWMEQEPVHAMS
jgi:hypothetical protein